MSRVSQQRDKGTGCRIFRTTLGEKFDVQLEEGASKAASKGIASYIKAYSEWGYVKQAFDYWAHKLRARLDNAR